VWGKTAPGIFLRSHAGQENLRTSVPPLHNGTVTHVSDQRPGPSLRPVLLVWNRRGDFFNLNLKFTPMGSQTLRPKCYRSQLTNSARGPFATLRIYKMDNNNNAHKLAQIGKGIFHEINGGARSLGFRKK
jgi:hypothetical protein